MTNSMVLSNMDFAKFDAFSELNENELMCVDGGGRWALLLSCFAIAVAPIVIAANPIAGVALLVAGIEVFVNNMNSI